MVAIIDQPLMARGAEMQDETPRISASLRLAEPKEIAGMWKISGSGRSDCLLRLEAQRIDSVNAYSLSDPSGCLTALVGTAIAGWRPSPEGIELAGSDRLTVLLFAYGDNGAAQATAADGTLLLLTRVK
jgi:hypothetical protein